MKYFKSYTLSFYHVCSNNRFSISKWENWWRVTSSVIFADDNNSPRQWAHRCGRFYISLLEFLQGCTVHTCVLGCSISNRSTIHTTSCPGHATLGRIFMTGTARSTLRWAQWDITHHHCKYIIFFSYPNTTYHLVWAIYTLCYWLLSALGDRITCTRTQTHRSEDTSTAHCQLKPRIPHVNRLSDSDYRSFFITAKRVVFLRFSNHP